MVAPVPLASGVTSELLLVVVARLMPASFLLGFRGATAFVRVLHRDSFGVPPTPGCFAAL